MRTFLLLALLALFCAGRVSAFTTRVTPRMGLFDALKGAFENDDSLQPQKGYADGKNKVMVTIQPGNKKIECVAGQSLKDITRQARCKIEYNCSRGECGTCEILVDGKRTRTCVSRLPAKQNVNIKVL